jgi:hypothetical protein
MASGPSLHQPHTLIFFVLALACLAVAAVVPMLADRDRGWDRRVAWAGVTGAAVAIFVACLPYWKLSIAASLVTVAFMTAAAYMSTPYIKIRGKVYAFHVRDSLPDAAPEDTAAQGSGDRDDDRAPDSYSGSVTAQKFWWLLVLTMAMCVGCVVVPAADKPWWLAPGAVIMLVVGALALGYEDASWGYAIARGQRVQFGVLTVVTAAAFTVVYLLAYGVGKRWPLRRKDSLEYRAHSRHRKSPR